MVLTGEPCAFNGASTVRGGGNGTPSNRNHVLYSIALLARNLDMNGG